MWFFFTARRRRDEKSEVKPGPWSEQKKKERAVPAALKEEEKKERDSELEMIADCLVATLNAACSRKKKRRK